MHCSFLWIMLPKPSGTEIIEPRYCPACRLQNGETQEGPLCAACGATLIVQGYCPVCESRWRLPVGASCPKHDVELVAEQPVKLTRLASGPPISWVTVAKFPHTLAVAPACIRLEAEGIPTFVEGERMGSPAMYRVATGGVKLQVPAELAADARVILAQNWSLPSDESELDDLLDEPFEEPRGEHGPARRWLVDVVVVAILITPLIVWLIGRLLGAVGDKLR
jgi:hypothetical protein